MILLAYALWLGPEYWPVTAAHAYGMLYEMTAEVAVLYGIILYPAAAAAVRRFCR